MGDRTSVHIEIGGKLREGDVQEFLGHCANEYLGTDYEGQALSEEELREAAKTGGLTLCVNDSYTSLDTLSFLAELGMSYRMTYDAGCGYPAGGELHLDGKTEEYASTGCAGEPLIEAKELINAPGAAIEWAERITADLPAFEIVEG